MRQFTLVILFFLGFSFLVSNGFAQSEPYTPPVLYWRQAYGGYSGGSGNDGFCLYLTELGNLPAGTEIVFNEITFENVLNVSSGSSPSSGTVFVNQWNSSWPVIVSLPRTDSDLQAGVMGSVLDHLPEAAKYDTFLLTPNASYLSIPQVTDINVFPTETNDGTNPAGLSLSGGMTAGIGNLSGSFTVTTDTVSDDLVFAYVPDPSVFASGRKLGRTYVTIDITIGEENYLWQHQPLGWMECAIPRLETNPSDGKLDFGNVRIGTQSKWEAL